MTNPTREQLLVAILKARNDGFRTYAEALGRLYEKLYGRQISCLTGIRKRLNSSDVPCIANRESPNKSAMRGVN